MQNAWVLNQEILINPELYHPCCLKASLWLNKFNFWSVHEIMNTSGLLQSKWRPKIEFIS